MLDMSRIVITHIVCFISSSQESHLKQQAKGLPSTNPTRYQKVYIIIIGILLHMHSLQFIGGSKPSQKPVSLVQMQRPVNTGGSVGALIAVWYSLFLDYA